MLFLLDCCTPMKNKGVNMSVYHSLLSVVLVGTLSSQRYKEIPQIDGRGGYLQLQHRTAFSSNSNYPEGLLREAAVASLLH